MRSLRARKRRSSWLIVGENWHVVVDTGVHKDGAPFARTACNSLYCWTAKDARLRQAMMCWICREKHPPKDRLVEVEGLPGWYMRPDGSARSANSSRK